MEPPAFVVVATFVHGKLRPAGTGRERHREPAPIGVRRHVHGAGFLGIFDIEPALLWRAPEPFVQEAVRIGHIAPVTLSNAKSYIREGRSRASMKNAAVGDA